MCFSRLLCWAGHRTYLGWVIPLQDCPGSSRLRPKAAGIGHPRGTQTDKNETKSTNKREFLLSNTEEGWPWSGLLNCMCSFTEIWRSSTILEEMCRSSSVEPKTSIKEIRSEEDLIWNKLFKKVEKLSVKLVTFIRNLNMENLDLHKNQTKC